MDDGKSRIAELNKDAWKKVDDLAKDSRAFITKAGKDLLQPLSTFLDLYEWRPGGRATPVVLAQFEDYAGAIGAALSRCPCCGRSESYGRQSDYLTQ